MSDLRCLHRGTVTADQIDHLGHMNVRYYASRSLAATRALAGEYGLDEASCSAQGRELSVPDQFTRHFREQLEGAELGVMTGVLSVREEGLRVYHELVNLDSGELAASFVHRLELVDRETREPRAFPAGLAERAQAGVVEWPERGRPRTLDLDEDGRELGLDEARERGLENRQPRTLSETECDARGFLQPGQVPELVWGGTPVRPRRGVPVYEVDGIRFGWATLESRSRLLATPRVGARVQSFGAEVAIAAKTDRQRYWVFDVDDGRLLSTFDVVNLAFDIGARRAIEIPDGIRRELETRYHPDLGQAPSAGRASSERDAFAD